MHDISVRQTSTDMKRGYWAEGIVRGNDSVIQVQGNNVMTLLQHSQLTS